MGNGSSHWMLISIHDPKLINWEAGEHIPERGTRELQIGAESVKTRYDSLC